MQWEKKGLIYGPSGRLPWAQHSALTPTPILIGPDTIRVYAGFRDAEGVSRIGYIDVDAGDPGRVIQISPDPVLDIGEPGAFDDNGVILGDVFKHGDEIYMYYVGFQLAARVKFLAFTGLAVSTNNGESFSRASKVPVLDRHDGGMFIGAIHSVIVEEDKWRAWFASGNGWQMINGTPYPQYHICYAESADGLKFEIKPGVCIEAEGAEYRVGRPRVYWRSGQYEMYYTKGDLFGNYLPGYAISSDGIHWKRLDTELGLVPSGDGWESETLCYPALIEAKGMLYAFYNGNNMGRAGFGYAVSRGG